MATLNGISPLLLVADLDRALAFYRDGLGFDCEVYGEPPNFAVVRRDAAVILLRLAPDQNRLVPNWQIADKAVDAYVRVDDADALYEEVQQRGARIDWTIYDAPHGFREFGVQDPDGHDIAFGQPLGD
ncbi:MAG: VOC family protein [Actinobacteria bacterium]|nr:VOC family protein [Actinomycetota bacterium]